MRATGLTAATREDGAEQIARIGCPGDELIAYVTRADAARG